MKFKLLNAKNALLLLRRRALKEDIDVSGITFRFKNNELRTMFMEILDDIVELKKGNK